MREGGGEERGKEKGDGEEMEWDIIRHGVGLRPTSEGGIRIEKESIALANGGGGATDGWVVHNYGHGGEGYPCSVGCAEDAVTLVKACFERSKEGQ